MDRLVGDHHRALPHHAFLDLGRHLVEPFGELGAVPWHASQTRRNVPEAHVGAFGSFHDHFEPVPCLNTVGEVFSVLEHFVDVLLQSGCALGTPHEPELEHVGPAATLDVLVAGVVLGVVELVLLEEIGGVGRVALRQDSLVAGQESGALLWSGEQLVWIPGDRVRSGGKMGDSRLLLFLLIC